MKAILFPEVNFPEFGKPKNWDDEKDGECMSIPASVQQDEHKPNRIYIVTAWKPSPQDLIEINAGKPIYLQCWGGMPPVSLYTVNDEGIPNFELYLLTPSEIGNILSKAYNIPKIPFGIYSETKVYSKISTREDKIFKLEDLSLADYSFEFTDKFTEEMFLKELNLQIAKLILDFPKFGKSITNFVDHDCKMQSRIGSKDEIIGDWMSFQLNNGLILNCIYNRDKFYKFSISISYNL